MADQALCLTGRNCDPPIAVGPRLDPESGTDYITGGNAPILWVPLHRTRHRLSGRGCIVPVRFRAGAPVQRWASGTARKPQSGPASGAVRGTTLKGTQAPARKRERLDIRKNISRDG